MFCAMSQHVAGTLPTCRQLVVVYRPTSSLTPDPRNARTHPKRQIEQIIASIREFGFTNPVLVDEADVLISGHGRLRAAKELGLSEVPTIELHGLCEVQKKALRLADNKIALNAGWDLEILRLELEDIGTLDVDFDLSLTGFASGEIDVILKAANDPDEEVIPAVPLKPKTRLGDIWVLGEHRIGCGDGRDNDPRSGSTEVAKVKEARLTWKPEFENAGYGRPPRSTQFKKGAVAILEGVLDIGVERSPMMRCLAKWSPSVKMGVSAA
jgi:hypothetical protein